MKASMYRRMDASCGPQMRRTAPCRWSICHSDRDRHVGPKTFGANRLKFTPDGKLVLISSLRDGDLVIYQAASRKEFKRVRIGHGAAGILIDRDGNRAFIACGPDNYVAILDLKTLTVTGHLDVGGEPDGLAWAIR